MRSAWRDQEVVARRREPADLRRDAVAASTARTARDDRGAGRADDGCERADRVEPDGRRRGRRRSRAGSRPRAPAAAGRAAARTGRRARRRSSAAPVAGSGMPAERALDAVDAVDARRALRRSGERRGRCASSVGSPGDVGEDDDRRRLAGLGSRSASATAASRLSSPAGRIVRVGDALLEAQERRAQRAAGRRGSG